MYHTNLSLVRHSEGTLNVGRQVSESSYEKRDAKQLLQKGRGELSLQLLIGVRVTCIQGARRFQESEQIKKGHARPNKQTNAVETDEKNDIINT